MILQRLAPQARVRATLSALALAAAASVLTAAVAQAGPAPSKASPSAWRPGWLPGDPPTADTSIQAPLWASPRSRAPGLLVAIDPVTRRPMTPSEAQRRAAAEAAGGDDAFSVPEGPLPVILLPRGGEMIHLQGRFQVFSIGWRDANGRIVTDCSLDPMSARELLTKPALARTAPRPVAKARWEEK